MGTNYYWHEKAPCETCGHQSEGLHIGKLSGGWTPTLEAHVEMGISTWAQWKGWLRTKGGEVRDEYNRPIATEEFIAKIETWQNGKWHDGTELLKHALKYPSRDDWLDPEGYSMTGHGFS